MFIETGPGTGTLTDPSTPRALSTEEVKELVELYAQAARNALEAGFDGVELHCANGYLVNQFISAHTNQRDDEYGGSLQNRLRFLREITLAVAGVVGKERVGVRFARCSRPQTKTASTLVWSKMILIKPTSRQ